MRVHANNGMGRITVLCLLAVGRVTLGNSVNVSGSQSTCPARSINYITQTLPQQCFTSSWASKPAAQTTSATPTSDKLDESTSVLASTVSSTRSPNDLLLPLTTDSEPSNAASNSSPSLIGHEAGHPSPSPERSGTIEPSPDPSQENDLDSPLDNSKFLSFEEWKHQNLAKVGQSAESLGKRQEGDGSEHRRRPASINNALDTFGEDSEIEIDFSGFVNAGGMNEALPITGSLPISSTVDQAAAPKENAEDLSNSYKRNKDAGKTCKERSNYASFDCAATVLKTNPECKSATSVLVESKDSYMLNVCSADNKFFILELCDDILVDTVVLANFEYFSSMFRNFRISVSDRYPVKMDRWKELGVFEARNSRAIQAFLIENPLIWARYLRVELLTHFGAEYYCPVSLLRVHGTTMMEEFNHEVKDQRPEDDPEDEPEGLKNEASIQLPDLAHVDAMSSTIENPGTATAETTSSAISTEETPSPTPRPITATGDILSSAHKVSKPYKPSIAQELEDILFCKNGHTARCSQVNQHMEPEPTSSSSSTLAPENLAVVHQKSAADVRHEKRSERAQESVQDAPVSTIDTPRNPTRPSQQHLDQNASSHSTSTLDSAVTNQTTASAHRSEEENPVMKAVGSLAMSKKDVAMIPGTTSKYSSGASSKTTARSPVQESTSLASSSPISSPSSHPVATPTSSVKTQTSPIQPPPANPSTQESFFKSVHKRLQQLEANSTLSLQYIEEQSRILRDAFSSVEKRQLSKTSTFLETLNTTVLTELRDFRMQYDQIWQSTVLELSSQREQSAQQVSVLSARMTFLADEIVFQKRIAMVQFMLILLCLGLIVFSRSGRTATSTYLEIPPLVQNAIKRSSANLARYTHFETPPASPSSSRPPSEGFSSKYSLFQRKSHRRTPSDESDGNVVGIQSPSIAYSPPSPVSQISRDDRDASPSGPSADELETMNFN